MRIPHNTRGRRRLVGAAIAGALVLAACGGSDDAADTIESGDATEQADAGASPGTTQPTDAAEATDAPAAEASSPAATGAGFADLVGPDVVPEADIASNLLPDVVLDDVTNGRKVNFRNLIPQDKPVLLWMYAPH